MSDEQDQARLLAERIARRMSAGDGGDARATPRAEAGAAVGEELAVMRASLQELQQRLARIESHVTREDTPTDCTIVAIVDSEAHVTSGKGRR